MSERRSNNWELLKQFVKTDFKIRYKGTYIGIFWVVIRPLSTFAIIYIVWSRLFASDPLFKMSLLLGIIIMNFYAEIMLMGLGALLNKSYIILKVSFPKKITLFSVSLVALIDFLINLFVFFVLSRSSNLNSSVLGVFLFILAILDLYLIGLAASTLTSILYVRFRDLFNLVDLTNQLLFWLTPVYYPLSILPESMQRVELYNPLAIIIDAARKGLVYGNVNSVNDFIPVLLILVITLIVLFVGLKIFEKKAIKVAEYY